MSRVRAAFVLSALLVLAGSAVFRLGADASQAAVSSTLHATVGPGYEISLTFDDGSAVRSLPAGAYRVAVSDLSIDHNFHLSGPGVEQETSVDGQGSSSWNVTFRAGSAYQFFCDPHADSMYGRFDASGAAEAPSSGGGGGGGGSGSGAGSGGGGGGSVAPGGARTLGTLAVATQGGKLKLTVKGKSVKTLRAGKYVFAVADVSRSSGVALRRAGASAKQLTGTAFVGRSTRGITLTAGSWTLLSGGATPVAFRVTKA